MKLGIFMLKRISIILFVSILGSCSKEDVYKAVLENPYPNVFFIHPHPKIGDKVEYTVSGSASGLSEINEIVGFSNSLTVVKMTTVGEPRLENTFEEIYVDDQWNVKNAIFVVGTNRYNLTIANEKDVGNYVRTNIRSEYLTQILSKNSNITLKVSLRIKDIDLKSLYHLDPAMIFLVAGREDFFSKNGTELAKIKFTRKHL